MNDDDDDNATWLKIMTRLIFTMLSRLQSALQLSPTAPGIICLIILHVHDNDDNGDGNDDDDDDADYNEDADDNNDDDDDDADGENCGSCSRLGHWLIDPGARCKPPGDDNHHPSFDGDCEHYQDFQDFMRIT